jgi:uncharacterized protein YgiM (DUF1202 family)
LQKAGTPLTSAATAVTKTVTAEVLNVRSGPTLDAKVLYKIARGKTVQVFYELNGWSKLSATTAEWVFSIFTVNPSKIN